MQIFRHLKRLVTDWFLCGMLLATLLAYLFPSFGATGGAMHAEWVVNIGIFVVFFLHGINLSGEQIRHGLRNTRLHVMVQLFTFGVFPLIWLVSDWLLGRHVPSLLMLGFFYLCVLPSTISSSVALTGSAGGNVPAAILNASLSSVLGIFLTPLLVSFVVGSGAGGIDLGATLLDLCLMLLLPVQTLHQHHRQTGDPAAGLRGVLQFDGVRDLATTRQHCAAQCIAWQCRVAGNHFVDDHPYRPGPAVQQRR
jgi:sodium/bile acid cotransporter 7